jgi:hypothetical protein
VQSYSQAGGVDFISDQEESMKIQSHPIGISVKAKKVVGMAL